MGNGGVIPVTGKSLRVHRLHDDLESDKFGGKAHGLSLLLRNRMPVPHGFALAWDEPCNDWTVTRGSWAVRSSAIGEDSSEHSFAGQHESLLDIHWTNVPGAVLRVRESCRTERVLAYRRQRGIVGEPRMGVVIQEMVYNVTHSAIVFTKDPQDDVDDIYIEVTEGLGDKLVGGKVDPMSWNIKRHMVRGHYFPQNLQELARLALECERIIGGYADVEAAYDGQNWWICQARRITT